MKLADEELDSVLSKAGLVLAQPYHPDGKYRKDEYLFTRCKTCGTEVHYRLKYILEKNEIGEKVCRACFWSGWYDEARATQHAAIKHMLDQGADLDCLIDQGVVSARYAMSLADAKELAEDNGFDLIDLLAGDHPGDDLLVVRCKVCGRQTVERPGDVRFGCTCGGAGKGVAYDREAMKVERKSAPAAPGQYQDGSTKLLKDSGSECVKWWDADANRGAIPDNLTCLSRHVYQWKCPDCGLQFKRPVYAVYPQPRCPYCTSRITNEFNALREGLSHMTAQDVPRLMDAWNDARDPSTIPLTSDSLVHLKCPKGHHPVQTLYTYLTNGCAVCRGLETKKITDQNCLAATDPELAAEWVRPKDGGPWTPQNVKDGSRRVIIWRCMACGHEQEMTVHDRQLRMNNRCPACGKIMGSLAWKYPQLAAEWSPDNPVSPWNIKPFSGLHFIPEWVCSKNPEHKWRMTTATRINKGRGCPYCEAEQEKGNS